MSDTAQGPGWWLASDGKWYPPQPVQPVVDTRAALQAALARQLRKGARVESQSDHSAVVVRGSKPNHVLHLILSVVTGGIWLVVWGWMVGVKKEHRIMVSVDGHGRVSVKKMS